MNLFPTNNTLEIPFFYFTYALDSQEEVDSKCSRYDEQKKKKEERNCINTWGEERRKRQIRFSFIDMVKWNQKTATVLVYLMLHTHPHCKQSMD